jgi:hypothetical protein
MHSKPSPILTLRHAMTSREGDRETAFQIGRGLSAWAIERRSSLHPGRPRTTIVFGTCRSDALRRASAPARLAEEIHNDVTDARRIETGWDEEIIWPFERETVA